jgi:mutator protein MutT
MCTIAILHGVVRDAPLVIAANRDELLGRRSQPPSLLDAARGVVGGTDLEAGGTWLAARADGRFAAVTNQRVMAAPMIGRRSRGVIVRELIASDDPDGYVAALDPRASASMNLIWGRAGRVRIAYARAEAGTLAIEEVGPGVHVLCNDRLGAPGFPRGARLARAIEAAMAAIVAGADGAPSWAKVAPRLEALLGDHARSPLAEVPPSDLPAEVAHAVTSVCIHAGGYGTRSASVIGLGDGVVGYRHADGPPCVTPFVDVAVPMAPAPRPRTLVVAGLLVADDGRVLISQRRADQKLPLQWEFPGGKVEPGEAPAAALARELREELGVTAEVGRIWEVLFHPYPAFDLVMLVYRCRLAPGEVARAVEVADVVWATPAEVAVGPWPILPADQPLVARLCAEGPPRWCAPR